MLQVEVLLDERHFCLGMIGFGCWKHPGFSSERKKENWKREGIFWPFGTGVTYNNMFNSNSLRKNVWIFPLQGEQGRLSEASRPASGAIFLSLEKSIFLNIEEGIWGLGAKVRAMKLRNAAYDHRTRYLSQH